MNFFLQELLLIGQWFYYQDNGRSAMKNGRVHWLLILIHRHSKNWIWLMKLSSLSLFFFRIFSMLQKLFFSWICHLLGDGTNLSRNYAFCRSISRKFHALKKLHNFNTIKYKSDCCKHNRTHHDYLAIINSLKNLRMWLLPKILSLNKIIIRQIIYFLKSWQLSWTN